MAKQAPGVIVKLCDPLLATETAPLGEIEWRFRFRGRPVHKRCHFFLMETTQSHTTPQRAEGITECKWAPYDEAVRLLGYENARAMLVRARAQLGAGA